MKNFKQRNYLYTIILLAGVTSCSKNNEQLIDNIYKHYNECLVTHTEDDGLGYSVNIFYNKLRNPDSIQLYGNTTAIEYDKIGRLSRVRFSTVQDHEDFAYNGTLLPTIMNYYVPNYIDYGMTDSLNATISFKYNYKGQIIQLKQVNLWYPGYDFALKYTYSNDGNLKTIINVPESGSPFTQFTDASYDNKPNFMGGNPWLRYILLLTGFEPYQYLLDSKNNAVDWTWVFDPSVPGYNFTSIFEYRSRGFATKVFLHAVDTQGTFIGDFTRTSSSTCDNNQHPSQTLLSLKRPKLFPVNQNKARGGLIQK